MVLTPPIPPLGALVKRRPMTVYTVSCPPAEAVARCAQFWRTIGIKRESTTMCKRFAGIGWSGTEVTVMPGQATASRRRFDDSFLELGEIAPGLVLGGIAVYLTSKVVRAQLRHLNKTRIVIAAHPSPDAAQTSTELWCFPWDTAIQRARPGKDPFARVFEYLHTSLHQQGILLAPPRLVDGEELPEDHPCPPTTSTEYGAASSIPSPSSSRRRSDHDPRFLTAPDGLPSLYLHAFIATDRHEAAAHCINYWASKWRSTPVETPGMRDQLAQHGWVGAEIIIGSDLRSLAIRPLLDAIPGINLVPSATPTPLKRTSQERTEILVAARSCSVGGRPASELWCCEARILHDDRWGTDAFMDMSFRELAGALQHQGLLLEAPRFFHGADLPKDHLFTIEGILTMRRAAKKEHGRRPIRFSGN